MMDAFEPGVGNVMKVCNAIASAFTDTGTGLGKRMGAALARTGTLIFCLSTTLLSFKSFTTDTAEYFLFFLVGCLCFSVLEKAVLLSQMLSHASHTSYELHRDATLAARGFQYHSVVPEHQMTVAQKWDEFMTDDTLNRQQKHEKLTKLVFIGRSVALNKTETGSTQGAVTKMWAEQCGERFVTNTLETVSSSSSSSSCCSCCSTTTGLILFWC